MVAGAFLIVAGVVLIAWQILIQSGEMPVDFGSRSINVEGFGAKGSLTTTYVGLIVIAIGALLETVGFLAFKPWQTGSSSAADMTADTDVHHAAWLMIRRYPNATNAEALPALVWPRPSVTGPRWKSRGVLVFDIKHAAAFRVKGCH